MMTGTVHRLVELALVAHDPKQTAADAIFVTRLGHRVAETSDLTRLRVTARLAIDLHPALESKVRPQSLMAGNSKWLRLQP